MSWVIRCDVCGGTITAHYDVFSHVHPPPSPQVQRAYQHARFTLLTIEKALERGQREQGRRRHARR